MPRYLFIYYKIYFLRSLDILIFVQCTLYLDTYFNENGFGNRNPKMISEQQIINLNSLFSYLIWADRNLTVEENIYTIAPCWKMV